MTRHVSLMALFLALSNATVFCMNNTNPSLNASNASDALDLINYVNQANEKTSLELFKNRLETITIAPDDYKKLTAYIHDQLVQKIKIQNGIKQRCLYGMGTGLFATAYGIGKILVWSQMTREESESPMECHATWMSNAHLFNDVDAILSGHGLTFAGTFGGVACLAGYWHLRRHNLLVVDNLAQMKTALQEHQQMEVIYETIN